MDPVEILKALPEVERLAWLQSHSSQLDSVELQNVANYFDAMGTSRDVVEFARTAGDTDAAESRTIAEDQRVAASRVIEEGLAQGKTTSQIVAEQAAQGNDISTLVPEVEDADKVLFDAGIEPDSSTVEDFLATVSLRYNETFETWEDFYNSPYYKDPLVPQMLETYAEAPVPEDSFTMRMFNGEEITYRAREFEAARELYGFQDEVEFQRVVRMADTFNMRRADGSGVAWQPLQALLESNGYLEGQRSNRAGATRLNEVNKRIREIEASLRTGYPRPGEDDEYARLKEERAEIQRTLPRAQGTPQNSPSNLARAYNEGMQLYGNDDLLAFFHANDEGLAARIQASNVEDGRLSADDARMAAFYLGKAGFDEDPMSFISGMIQTGYTEAGGALTAAALADYLQVTRGPSGAGAGSQRQLPDPVAVQQAAKDFYRGLFLEDPDEATLASFSSQIMGAINGAPDNQSIDPNARIRQIAEGLPEYAKYYGKKPAGMTEEEYQGMHRQAQSSMLGAELADNQAVRIGMQDGAYQTTVGAAAGTKEAWDNSTFLGRLARASQTVSRNT